MTYKAWKTRCERVRTADGDLASHTINSLSCMRDKDDKTSHKLVLGRGEASFTIQRCQQTMNNEGKGGITLNAPEESNITGRVPGLGSDFVGEGGDTCVICLDVLEDNDRIRVLRCFHYFHQICLDPWLTCRRGECPLCKADCYHPQDPRYPQKTSQPNNASQTTHQGSLAPIPPALPHFHRIFRMRDSREPTHDARPLPLYTFWQERNLGGIERSPNELERGEM